MALGLVASTDFPKLAACGDLATGPALKVVNVVKAEADW